ncbi:MAG: tetratricopeptide repeat protein, partial [Candidatus Sumerlaeota bacterium]
MKFARETGYGSLAWWVMAQGAAAAESPEEQQRLAQAAKETLLAQVVYSQRPNDLYPDALFNELEATQLSKALGENDLAGLWTITDEWRTIRLRWMANRSTPATHTQDEAAWLAAHEILRMKYRDTQEKLRNTPLISTVLRQRTVAQATELEKQIADSLSTGQKAGYPAADLRGLQPLPFDQLSALLQPPFFTTKPPVFALHRSLFNTYIDVVYTADGAQLKHEPPSAPPESLNFIFGENDGSIPLDFIHVLSSRSLLTRMSGLTLRTSKASFEYPPQNPDGEKWITDLRLASSLTIKEPAQPLNILPALWTIRNSSMTLGELLKMGSNLDSVSMSIANGENPPDAKQDLAAALALSAAGAREATIDGKRWLGTVIEPQQAPQRAQEELAVLATKLDRAISANNEEQTVVSIESIILLKEALNDQTDLQLYYGKLAEQRGRLGKWADAVEAAKRRVDSIDKDAELNLHAQAEKQLGDMAANARTWGLAFDSYDKAIEEFKGANDLASQAAASESKAIALEIAGRFQESIDQSIAARTLFGSDVAATIRQDLRVARIQRIYFNQYDEAEKILLSVAEAAEKASLPQQVAEAKINLARNDISLARFDEARARIDEVAKIAEDQNSETYRAQAKLESANAHWLRSEYFDAFREEQEILEIATRTNDVPVEISVRNISGLTAWSVNDLKRAYTELNQGLELAEKSGDDAKIASTANNIGLLNRSEKKYEEALNWFDRALKIDTLQGNRWGEAYDLRNTGITLHLAGRSPEAIDPLMRAVTLAGEIGDKVNLTKAQLALADAQAAIQNAQLAQSGYEAALEKARAIPLPEVQWRALYGLGRLALSAGNDKQTLSLYNEAAVVVDGLRASIRIEELQDGFLLDKQGLYDEIVELQLQRGNAAGALEASERARGRNFIDLLGNHRINLGNITDQNLLDRESALRSRVEALERKVNAAA